MEPRRRRQIAITAGFGLLVTTAWMASCQRRVPPFSPPIPPPASNPSQAVLRRAWAAWQQAQNAVNDERAALEGWDSGARPPGGEELFRRRLMARDTHGHLARARRLAEQALACAETRTQQYAAFLLLVRIASDAGHPGEELRFAHRLMAIDPAQPRARSALQDALKHASAQPQAAVERSEPAPGDPPPLPVFRSAHHCFQPQKGGHHSTEELP